jgi:hypothetical protein
VFVRVQGAENADPFPVLLPEAVQQIFHGCVYIGTDAAVNTAGEVLVLVAQQDGASAGTVQLLHGAAGPGIIRCNDKNGIAVSGTGIFNLAEGDPAGSQTLCKTGKQTLAP